MAGVYHLISGRRMAAALASQQDNSVPNTRPSVSATNYAADTGKIVFLLFSVLCVCSRNVWILAATQAGRHLAISGKYVDVSPAAARC